MTLEVKYRVIVHLVDGSELRTKPLTYAKALDQIGLIEGDLDRSQVLSLPMIPWERPQGLIVRVLRPSAIAWVGTEEVEQ